MESNERIKQTLRDCQEMLVRMLPTQLNSCKSRLVLHDVFVIANDDVKNAFVHLDVKVLKGRTPDLLANISRELHTLLNAEFIKSSQHLNLGVSVEISEISDSYAK